VARSRELGFSPPASDPGLLTTGSVHEPRPAAISPGIDSASPLLSLPDDSGMGLRACTRIARGLMFVSPGGSVNQLGSRMAFPMVAPTALPRSGLPAWLSAPRPEPARPLPDQRRPQARQGQLSSPGARPSTDARFGERPSVLLIDDAVRAGDPLVRLLTLDGFAVELAGSGATGLTLARSRSYDAIVLDLHLPDVPGLTVLEELRRVRITVPVIAVTGYYLGVDYAVTAMKRGATDFKLKPLDAEELAAAVRAAMLDTGRKPQREPEALRELLQLLNGRDGGERKASWEPPASRRLVPGEARHALVASLAQALTDPSLSVRLFLACADGLKRAVQGGRVESRGEIADRLRENLACADCAPEPADPRVVKALAMLQTSVRRGTRCLEVAVARELNVDRAHLGRVILRDTGLGFRDWRRAFAMRAAADKLSNPEVRVSEIAAHLGYKHLSQFDREFRGVFGTSPHAFRRLLPPS